MPKVSVIVPVYGVEKYIERCARSLFEQTLDDIEYLFIDDCTPDRSIDILNKVLEEYPQRKSQVVIHRMEHNSGQAKVREWGMKNATGEYVIHCDSDDWIDTDMYRAMYVKAKEDEADVVVCDFKLSNGKVWYTKKGCFNSNLMDFTKDLLYEKCGWNLWNKLFKKSIVEKINYYPQYNMGEDLVMTMQMIYFCSNMSYISNPYYFYFFNPNSIVRQKSAEAIIDKYMQYRENCFLLKQFYLDMGCYNVFKNEFDWIKYSIRRSLFVKNNKVRSLRRKVYPLIEVKLLFNPDIAVIQRKELIKVILDQIFFKM